MSRTPIQETRDRLAKIYAIGILAFAALVGFITLFAAFFAHLNLT